MTATSLSIAHSVRRSSRSIFDASTRRMISHRRVCAIIALAALCFAGGLIAAHSAQARIGDFAMLRQLEPGLWMVRYRNGAGAPRVCVRSGLELLSIKPITGPCQRSTVEDQADRVVVQNSCQKHGYTRTSIRRESNSLVQIESQGFVEGVPFTLSAEARRVGAC